MKRIYEIPFSPEKMDSLICVGIDGTVPEDSSNSAEVEEMKQNLHVALEDLTQRQLEVVKMYFWEGMTQEQIGEELGIKQKVVNLHLQRALSKLKNSKQFVNIIK